MTNHHPISSFSMVCHEKLSGCKRGTLSTKWPILTVFNVSAVAIFDVFLLLTFLLSACTLDGETPTEIVLPTASPQSTFVGAIPVSPVVGLPPGTDGYAWWNDSTFYEVFVRSFYDSDGDGIGDFNGITEKLDYLQDLGITALWLMPIFPSPSYHGYDVTDYYAVNPDYGSMDDFKALLLAARERDIRIVIDMVLNHTSAQHPWFIESQDPDSVYRDWYIWSESNPGWTQPWGGGKVWHRQSDGNYYYGVFWDQMPDLNYGNPAVVEEMNKVVCFWLEDVGVDGFRLDGARYVVEEGSELADTESNHQFFRDYRIFYKDINPQAVTIGEVWTSSFAVASYVKEGDQLDLAFDFDLANAFIQSAKDGRASAAASALTFNTRLFPQLRSGIFLTNHDMNRTMDALDGDVNKARLAASMLLTAPGVPFLYYGEEIGMTGQKPDEKIRVPMQWTSGENAGFTTSTPWQAINSDYVEKNVAAQLAVPGSLLNHYRSLSQLRKQHVALRVGEYIAVESKDKAVLAFLRASQDEILLVLVNLSDEPTSRYDLKLRRGLLPEQPLVFVLFGYDGKITAPLVSDVGGFDDYLPVMEIPAYGTVIIQFQSGSN